MTVESRSDLRLAGGKATFSFAGHSDRGVIRTVNEDSFVAVPPVFVVADGMGGHAHGDVASQAAIAAFTRRFSKDAPARADEVLDTIRQANDDVIALTRDRSTSLSGTTLSGVALVRIGDDDHAHWMVFNVGDSRVYSWDGRALAQVSVDHSVVQELVTAGLITRLEADSHPDRNVITRALGADREVDPDIWLLPASGHQEFLICSDGLTKELSDDEIARIIVFHAASSIRESEGSRLSLAERLVNAAVVAGGSDNITVVVVECQLAGERPFSEDTVDRAAMPGFLEETMPRGAV